MRDLWNLPAIAKWEKSCGKHPTQKPLPLLARIILASTKENAWILDPFSGSSTTGIAANLFNRRFLGIEKETEFLKMSKRRRKELENPEIRYEYKKRLEKYSDKPLVKCHAELDSASLKGRFRNIHRSKGVRWSVAFGMTFSVHEDAPYFGADLPF